MLMHHGSDVDSILLKLMQDGERKAYDKTLAHVISLYGARVWELPNSPRRIYNRFKETPSRDLPLFARRNAQTRASLRMLPDGRRSSSLEGLASILECLIRVNALNLAGAKLLQSSFRLREP